MNVGNSVRVLEPFNEFLPDVYTVLSVGYAEDGQMVVYLTGIHGAFDIEYLELVQ